MIKCSWCYEQTNIRIIPHYWEGTISGCLLTTGCGCETQLSPLNWMPPEQGQQWKDTFQAWPSDI